MNIQQSLNQMLYTATIAAGLYAQSPAGQEGAALQRNNRDTYRNRNKAVAAAEAMGKDGDPKVLEQTLYGTVKEEARLAQEAFNLKPTVENADRLELSKQAVKNFKETVLKRQKTRHDTLRGQKEGTKKRKQAVEGTPKAPAKNTKVEVNTDGKK